jgi:hypothetical protein
MDEVARIERDKRDDDGNLVESSFHPFFPHDEKSVARPKLKHRRKKRVKKEPSTNGNLNGNGKNNNGKGKEPETQTDSSSSDGGELGKFYPYHYFDYIAGTSTGGFVFSPFLHILL